MDTMNKTWSGRNYALIGYTTVFVLLGGMAAWAALTRINGAVVASGIIEVASNRQVVQHLTGGVVGKINVHEGDRVKAGQVLFVPAEMEHRFKEFTADFAIGVFFYGHAGEQWVSLSIWAFGRKRFVRRSGRASRPDIVARRVSKTRPDLHFCGKEPQGATTDRHEPFYRTKIILIGGVDRGFLAS